MPQTIRKHTLQDEGDFNLPKFSRLLETLSRLRVALRSNAAFLV